MTKSSMILYGKKSVLQRLKNNPKSIRRIFLDDVFDDGYTLTIATRRKIPIIRKRKKEFLRLKRADRLQGIIAEVDKFEYTPLEELLYLPEEQRLSFVFLDSINDPHNLGSIMRSLACLGNFAMVIPKHEACEVNDTVMHVATGGENFVPVSMVTNIPIALRQAKKAGYWVVGSVVEDGEDISGVKFPFPLCFVLGSEGKGIRPGIQKQLDVKVSLPMPGAKLSYNVAMACAIFCYTISQQRAQ